MDEAQVKATRVRLVVSGRVQGVAYRANARRQAMNLSLTGWVKNLPDGRVEALAEGPAARVDAFLAWCKDGPPASRVTGVDVLERTEGPPKFSTFDVMH